MDQTRDDAAARHRFESFKLGMGLPSSAPKHAHSRSHSRNLSISSSFSKSTTVNDFSHFSLPSAPAPSLSLTFPSPSPSPTTPSPTLQPSSKRNSHHRRRSSVSTRHESAEMMGVALPDLPPSTSDDNINLGEKDSIRRRALWALEGKPDVAFNKVEIPDISTADMDKIIFDLASKTSSAPTFMGNKRDSFKLLGTSSSAKDQLGTLVEEEEEEDDSPELSQHDAVKDNLPPQATPVLAVTKPTPSKPRPSNLNLRPLSLTPENLQIAPGLPSPSPTPSPRSGLRELSLSPSSSIDDTASTIKLSRRTSLVISPPPASRRPVLNLALEQLENSSTCDDDSKPTRRSSISYKRSSHGSVTTNIAGLPTPEMTPTFGRRYSNDRESISSLSLGTNDDFFPVPPTQTRPLSASEQHFLFKSHNALLARITDLERALSMRRRESGGGYSNGGSSRPMSAASNRSSLSDSVRSHSPSPSEPSDEMLRLIADLKAERDELKRDADGWRTRVGDMENQIGVLAKRVENERRDAWVARSRVGLLEVEKGVLARKLDALETLRTEEKALQAAAWDAERTRLIANEEEAKRRVAELEEELARVRKELEAERLAKSADPLATPTPRGFDARASKMHGLGLASVDSESTDVELDSDGGQHNPFAFKLGAVKEESESDRGEYSYSEDTYYDDEEENALAGYEDEEDTDMSLQSSSSYSGSEEDLPRVMIQREGMNRPASPSTPRPNQVFTPPRPSHERRATLSKTWKFPFGGQPKMAAPQEKTTDDDDEQDRFFGCLDDGENDGERSVPSSPSAYSYEKSKGIFASGFKFAPSNDNASFFVPGVGFPCEDEEDTSESDERTLSVVAEEEEEEEEDHQSEAEDDDDMFGVIGGIRITFTPPQEEEVKEERKQIQITSPVKRTSPPPVLPALDFGLDDEDEDNEDDTMEGVIPFNFGRSLMEERQPSPPLLPVRAATVVSPPSIGMITPPSSLPRGPSPAVSQRPASPSMIPRPASPSVPRPVVSSKPAPSATVAETPTRPAPLRAMTLPMSPTSFITPPTKRAGSLMSFIPTPVSSPSPMRTAQAAGTRPKVAIPTSTFIRQPTRKSLLPSTTNKAAGTVGTAPTNVVPTNITRTSSSSSDYAYSSTPSSSNRKPQAAASSFYNFFDVNGAGNDASSSAQMKSVDFSHDHTLSSSSAGSADSQRTVQGTSSGFQSPSSASSLSSMVSSPFKSLSSFIPLSWSNAPSPHSHERDDSDYDIAAPSQAKASQAPPAPKNGGYVSREKQLRKLQMRMQVEGAVPMSSCVGMHCRNCDGSLVFI